jgi:type I restriction-modification system DNA methylase subunit
LLESLVQFTHDITRHALIPLSYDKITSILWKDRDSFRDTVDLSKYKNSILVVLFFKYVSYVRMDHYEGYKKQYGDNEKASFAAWLGSGSSSKKGYITARSMGSATRSTSVNA